MTPSSIPSPGTHEQIPLCPECGATSIRIRTSIEVEVDVIVERPEDVPVVMDEVLGDATWDEASLASCPQCGWKGKVGNLHRRTLTTLAAV